MLTGNVTGSGVVGTSFATTLTLRLDQIIAPTASVSLNSNKITNLATPTVSTDAATKGYVDSAVTAGTIVLTGNVTGSGVVGTSFATTIVSTLDQIPLAAAAVDLNSKNIKNVANLGIGVSSPTFPIHFAAAVDQCKICLYPGASAYQSFGFGVQPSTLAYSVPSSGNDHVFYCGASSTTSTELFRIAGTGAVTLHGALNANTNQINGVAMAGSPAGTDAVNVSYLNSRIAAGTIVLTGNVTGSGVVGTSFATTIASTLDQIPVAASTVNINSQNIQNVLSLGLTATVGQCKINLYPISNSYQSFGFGVQSSTLAYNVPNSGNDHVFYCGASSTTSTELFRIAGSGYVSNYGGSGTFYSRVPSAQVQMVTNTTTTSCTANTLVKVAGTTSASGLEVQFTTSTTNRITFTGSHISQACVGMASAAISFYATAALQHFGICIVKNGTTQVLPFQYTMGNYDVATATAYMAHIAITPVLVSLSPGDYLEVWMFCDATTNIKVNALNLAFQAS